MSTSRTTYRLLPLILVLALFAACSGGNAAGDEGLATLGEPGQSGESATTTTASAADVEEAALAFSQCMRDEGVTDFPDPQFSEGGGGVTLGSPDGEDGGIDFQSDEVQAAFEECGELLERAAFGPGGGNFDETELQDNLLAMAECLRDQGLDVDDPDLSNFGPVAGGPPPDDEASEDEGDGEGTAGTPRTRVFSIFGDLDMDDPGSRRPWRPARKKSGLVGIRSRSVDRQACPDQHGGRVFVEDAPDGGAVVGFDLNGRGPRF